MEHIGIDVHKVESQICILTESGEVVERRIRTQRERFAAVLGEKPRAKSAHQVEAYLGLTPSEWSSGEKHSKGHITKAGNSRTRRLLVQVAVSILRLRSSRTEALRKWATGIAARRGKKIAIVALARRMTGVLFAMMRDRTCYFQATLPEPSTRVA
jgi:transposase